MTAKENLPFFPSPSRQQCSVTHTFGCKSDAFTHRGKMSPDCDQCEVVLCCQHDVTPPCARAQSVSHLLGMTSVRVRPVQHHREKMLLLFTSCVAELSPRPSSVSLLGDSLWLLWHVWTQQEILSGTETLLGSEGQRATQNPGKIPLLY